MNVLPQHVDIVEVGPRDGLQNEAHFISTAQKIELINRLSQTGLKTVEATSFVNPKAVPQMSDAKEVLTGISRMSGVTYPVLTPNIRGYETAVEAGATSVSIFAAASESFSQRNIRASIAESIERFKPIVTKAQKDNVHVRGYISTAWGCPFEGAIEPKAVLSLANRMLDLGVSDLSIGDTIGVATPNEIEKVIAPLLDLSSDIRIALHLHDTRGMAIANAWAGLHLGVSTFDTSVGGLGGCPFAPGATGNLATEDLVWLLHRSGVETGIDLPKLIDTANWVLHLVGKTSGSHISTTRLWPWNSTDN